MKLFAKANGDVRRKRRGFQSFFTGNLVVPASREEERRPMFAN
jgi:hypothetical protein